MGTVAMPSRFASVLKLSVLLTTLVLMGVGILWVADIFSTETAKDYGLKALLVMAVFTVGSLVIASLGGGPAGPKNGPPPTA